MNKDNTTTVESALQSLTLMQQLFVNAYLTPGTTYGNATESASVAGYKGTRTALSVVGTRNLANSRIADAITSRRNQFANETDDKRRLCEQKLIDTINSGDLRPAELARVVEVLGKMSGWHSQTTVLETRDRQQQLTEAEADLARRAALATYERQALPPVVDAEIVDEKVEEPHNDND